MITAYPLPKWGCRILGPPTEFGVYIDTADKVRHGTGVLVSLFPNLKGTK